MTLDDEVLPSRNPMTSDAGCLEQCRTSVLYAAKLTSIDEGAMSVCDGPRVSKLDESRKKNSLAPAKTRRAA